jgi:hypothetical protein
MPGRLSRLGSLPLTQAASSIVGALGERKERAFRREQFEFQKEQAGQAQQQQALKAATDYANAIAQLRKQEEAASDAAHSRAITNIKVAIPSVTDEDMSLILQRNSEALGGVYDDIDFRGREKELAKDLVKIDDTYEKNLNDPNRDRILTQQLISLQRKYPKHAAAIATDLAEAQKNAREAELGAKPALAAKLDKAGPFAREKYIRTGELPGRTPAQKTRAISTIGAGGEPVTRIVPDVPGQQFAVPEKEGAFTIRDVEIPGLFDEAGNVIKRPMQFKLDRSTGRLVSEEIPEAKQLRAAPADVKFKEGVPKIEKPAPVTDLDVSRQKGFVDGLAEAGKALSAQPFTKAEDRQLKEMREQNSEAIIKAIKANPRAFKQTKDLTTQEIEALTPTELNSLIESVLIDRIKRGRFGQ